MFTSNLMPLYLPKVLITFILLIKILNIKSDLFWFFKGLKYKFNIKITNKKFKFDFRINK